MSRPALASARAILAILLAACSALALAYPTKPVRIIVPSAPGGGYDYIGRLLADRLSRQLGQAFVVENRTGAGTLVGTQAALQPPIDGHTLLVGGLANMAFNAGLYSNPGYDPVNDFTPIALVSSNSYALVARRDLPLSTLREVVDFARANPGKLTIATAGTGTGQHIAAALLKQLTRTDILEVPFKGAQPALTEVLAGRVDLFFDNAAAVRPMIESGRVKVIATSGATRDAVLPKVPTSRESGVEELVLEAWIGLFAPAKTPPAVVEQLRSAAAKVMQAPEFRQRLQSDGYRVLSMPAKEAAAFVQAEARKWLQVIRQAGIRAE